MLLEWQRQMGAPRLAHGADGSVSAVIGERTVVFPNEAAARFFHAAYTAVPALAGQVATLQAQVDEGALYKALARAQALEAERDALIKKLADLEARHVKVVQRQAKTAHRATVLTKALRRVRDAL